MFEPIAKAFEQFGRVFLYGKEISHEEYLGHLNSGTISPTPYWDLPSGNSVVGNHHYLADDNPRVSGTFINIPHRIVIICPYCNRKNIDSNLTCDGCGALL